MSRFLTGVQLLASFAVSLILIAILQTDASVQGTSLFNVGGYIALVAGVFLLVIQLISSKLRGASAKLSLFLRIILSLVGVILLNASVRGFFEGLVPQPMLHLLIVTGAVFFLTLFFVPTKGKKRGRKIDDIGVSGGKQ